MELKPTANILLWLICFRVDSNYNVYFKVIIQCQLKEFGEETDIMLAAKVFVEVFEVIDISQVKEGVVFPIFEAGITDAADNSG